MNEGTVTNYPFRFNDITAWQWLCVNPDMPSSQQVVGYYRHPDISGKATCPHCGGTMHYHGWLDQPNGNDQTVCPGDWVLTIPGGTRWVLSEKAFGALFDTENVIVSR